MYYINIFCDDGNELINFDKELNENKKYVFESFEKYLKKQIDYKELQKIQNERIDLIHKWYNIYKKYL